MRLWLRREAATASSTAAGNFAAQHNTAACPQGHARKSVIVRQVHHNSFYALLQRLGKAIEFLGRLSRPITAGGESRQIFFVAWRKHRYNGQTCLRVVGGIKPLPLPRRQLRIACRYSVGRVCRHGKVIAQKFLSIGAAQKVVVYSKLFEQESAKAAKRTAGNSFRACLRR